MMMYGHSMIYSAVAAVCMIVLVSATEQCPEDVIDRVRACTARLLPDLSKTSGPASYSDHVDAARDTCRDSRLRDAADCIQSNLDLCKGTKEREQTLQRLIDKAKTLQTVEYFCKHLAVYERHAQCISSHHKEVLTCSEEARKNFEVKMNAGATMDTLITGSCRFHAVARACLTNTTDIHCGSEAAKFVYDLLTGQMPPYCEYRAEQPDTSTHTWYTRREHEREQERGHNTGNGKRDGGYDTGNTANSGHVISSSGMVVLLASSLGLLLNKCIRCR